MIHDTAPEFQPASLFGFCPQCGDALQLYHTHNERRPRHFLGCLSYPRCSYIGDYDGPLHTHIAHQGARLARLEAQCDARLVWLEAQYAWLLCQVEHLRAQAEEVLP